MLTLIKREIEEAIVFFAINVAAVITIVSVLTYHVATGQVNNPFFGVPSIVYETLPLFLLMPFISAIFGVVQMSAGKEKNTTSFLATLATTRKKILTARIIAGLLWILLVLLPVAIAYILLLRLFPRAALPDAGFFIKAFTTVCLCNIACYALGLQMASGSNKQLTLLPAIAIVPVLLSIIVIKGFGAAVILTYLLFAIFAMVRTWQKFMSASF